MVNILTPVIFMHGMWLHANSWENWVKLFRRLGYVPLAPGWPGEDADVIETRLTGERMAGASMVDIVQHYRAIVAQQEAKPVLIGHGLGGLVAQKLLGENLAAAAVAIAPVQPKGIWRTSFRQITAAFPAYKNPFYTRRAVALTAGNFRYAFGNALSAEESIELYTRWSIPSPAKPLFTAALANFSLGSSTMVDAGNAERAPLLLLGAGRDNAVPISVVRAQRDLYAKSSAITDIHEFSGRGHSFSVDSGWRDVANLVAEWLERRVPTDEA